MLTILLILSLYLILRDKTGLNAAVHRDFPNINMYKNPEVWMEQWHQNSIISDNHSDQYDDHNAHDKNHNAQDENHNAPDADTIKEYDDDVPIYQNSAVLNILHSQGKLNSFIEVMIKIKIKIKIKINNNKYC